MDEGTGGADPTGADLISVKIIMDPGESITITSLKASSELVNEDGFED